MRKSIVVWAAWLAMLPLQAGALPKDITTEWQKLREELRKLGYPVAARVETQEEVAADMERVRREMERRAGKPAVSDMQRIGGGGGGPLVPKTRPQGLQTGSLRK